MVSKISCHFRSCILSLRVCIKRSSHKSWFVDLVLCLWACSMVGWDFWGCSSIQSLSRVRLIVTPWTAARQASLSMTNSQSPSKPMSIESVGDAIQPSQPLLSPSPPALNHFQHQGLFKWVSSSHQVAKYWCFSFNISPSKEHPGLITFRMDWLDLLAVQGTLKSLQHHSSKASILWHSVFFTVQFSHPYVTTGKTIALTRWTLVDKVVSAFYYAV